MNGNTSIVMELANEDLYTYMTNNPEFQTLQKDQRNQIFYQMVSAVKELHDLGYPHGDLKPDHFLVFRRDKEQLTTKLIDFGLCQQKDIPLMQRLINGGALYLAPEVLTDQKGQNSNYDSWALGCIWYELLTGDPFFKGNTENEIFRKFCKNRQR